MKQIVLVGAGQMGKAALQLVNFRNYSVQAFADNNRALWGTAICGIPVLSVPEAVAREPDAILIAVAGEVRAKELQTQVLFLGYGGEVQTLADYSEKLDIRGAVFERLSERLRDIPGDLAELGVYQGEFASQINRMFPERTLYLFDTFEGFDSRDLEGETAYSNAKKGDFSDTSPDFVLAKMTAPETVVLRKGYFPETAQGLDTKFAFVSLDADLYEPTLQGLQYFYPRMSPGGVILLHDYNNRRFSGVRAAVDAYEQEMGRLLFLPVGDLHGSVMIVHP